MNALNFLTISEHNKIFEISGRLGTISSPVLRLQAILQFSQIVDMLSLGDTAKEKMQKDFQYIDELENQLNELDTSDEFSDDVPDE